MLFLLFSYGGFNVAKCSEIDMHINEGAKFELSLLNEVGEG